MAVAKLAYRESGDFVAACVFPDSGVERKASIQDLQSLAAAVEPELHGLHVAHAELSDPFVLRAGTVVNERRYYLLDGVELPFVAPVAIGLIEHVGLLRLLLE